MRWFYQGRDISWHLGRLRLAWFVCLPDHLMYSFESDNELRNLILGIVEPDSLIFVEFEDFEYKYPIKGVFAKPNRFFNKNRLALMIQSFGGQEVW